MCCKGKRSVPTSIKLRRHYVALCNMVQNFDNSKVCLFCHKTSDSTNLIDTLNANHSRQKQYCFKKVLGMNPSAKIVSMSMRE